MFFSFFLFFSSFSTYFPPPRTSFLFLTRAVPCHHSRRCQTTTLWRMSSLGGAPKTCPDSLSIPAVFIGSSLNKEYNHASFSFGAFPSFSIKSMFGGGGGRGILGKGWIKSHAQTSRLEEGG